MRLLSISVLLFILSAGCGPWVHVELAEVNGSGESGTATLSTSYDFEEGGTDVTIQVSRGSDSGKQEIHFHQGKCSTPGPIPERQSFLKAGTNESKNFLKGDHINIFTGGKMYIDIHSSVDDSIVTCGDIP